MERFFNVFVGYFRRDARVRMVMKYLVNLCPAALRVELFEVRVGLTGRVYSAKLVFASEPQARQFIRLLHKQELNGMPLEVRPWVERTAANERRNVNWRIQVAGEPANRRHKDRRSYSPPVVGYVKGLNGGGTLMKWPARPAPRDYRQPWDPMTLREEQPTFYAEVLPFEDVELGSYPMQGTA